MRPRIISESTRGRFSNPFVSTELVWDRDLNFDGLSSRYGTGKAFLTVGAFAVETQPSTSLNSRRRSAAATSGCMAPSLE